MPQLMRPLLQNSSRFWSDNALRIHKGARKEEPPHVDPTSALNTKH